MEIMQVKDRENPEKALIDDKGTLYVWIFEGVWYAMGDYKFAIILKAKGDNTIDEFSWSVGGYNGSEGSYIVR